MDAALTVTVKREALRLGFSAAHIASVSPAEHAEAYRQWIAEDMHGEMGYMTRNPDRRTDPTTLLANARSAVVVALNYYQTVPEPRPLEGIVSRYALGADYHEVMWERLNALLDFVRTLRPEANGRGFVDTAPILERDLAAQTGLGWIGKNTCLITPGVGSWYFLGELLLDIELVPDAPIGDHCGSCTRCLTACPTNAFAGPHVLDARRCISYLTIELKGPIPRDLRPLMGAHIYGCDICQDVCPHNKWQAPTLDAALAPYTGLANPDLVELLSLDNAGFRERFRHSPIRRTKRRGLLRNVCVALGNSGDSRAVPSLIAALHDHEPLIRGHAAWALGQLGGAVAHTALEDAATTETDAWVREEIGLAVRNAARYRFNVLSNIGTAHLDG